MDTLTGNPFYRAADHAMMLKKNRFLSTDISEVLATLVTGRAQTAAGSGISGARHAQAESNTNSMEDVGAAFDELIDRVKGLRQRTAEATLFLSAYNIRRAHEVCTIK